MRLSPNFMSGGCCSTLGRESVHQPGAVGTAQARAGIPPAGCPVPAEVAAGVIVTTDDVVEGASAYDRVTVEKWVDESHGLPQLLIEQCDQTCPQRSHCAGSSDHELLSVYTNDIAGGGIRIARDVRHASSARMAWID